MVQIDHRVDKYIEKSASFAQPLLTYLRQTVHQACPDVEETIKWGSPAFEYNGPLFGMAAFKQHCAFIFRNAPLMSDPHKIFPEAMETAMGHLGQIKDLADLPAQEVLLAYLLEAVELNKSGIKVKRTTSGDKELNVPDFFKAALSANTQALQVFENFTPAKKREYIDWITEAKTEETRNKRLTTSIEWIAEGKDRNWKYQRKTVVKD